MLCSILGLERGTEYSFRVAALTINGTGIATDWISAETFESDLDGMDTKHMCYERESFMRKYRNLFIPSSKDDGWRHIQ